MAHLILPIMLPIKMSMLAKIELNSVKFTNYNNVLDDR